MKTSPIIRAKEKALDDFFKACNGNDREALGLSKDLYKSAAYASMMKALKKTSADFDLNVVDPNWEGKWDISRVILQIIRTTKLLDPSSPYITMVEGVGQTEQFNVPKLSVTSRLQPWQCTPTSDGSFNAEPFRFPVCAWQYFQTLCPKDLRTNFMSMFFPEGSSIGDQDDMLVPAVQDYWFNLQMQSVKADAETLAISGAGAVFNSSSYTPTGTCTSWLGSLNDSSDTVNVTLPVLTAANIVQEMYAMLDAQDPILFNLPSSSKMFIMSEKTWVILKRGLRDTNQFFFDPTKGINFSFDDIEIVTSSFFPDNQILLTYKTHPATGQSNLWVRMDSFSDLEGYKVGNFDNFGHQIFQRIDFSLSAKVAQPEHAVYGQL